MLGSIPFSHPPASNHSPHSSSQDPGGALVSTKVPAWSMKRGGGEIREGLPDGPGQWDFTAFLGIPEVEEGEGLRLPEAVRTWTTHSRCLPHATP